jgi:hypothetical protein
VVPQHFDSRAAAADRVPRLLPQHYRFSCEALREGARPTFSCDDERWSAMGCWHSVEPDFSVARHYDLALKYEALPAEAAADRQRAVELDELLEHGVYSTQDSLGLYFGQLGCRWYLLAMDTVTPCSA